ncbi:hypothetical protein FCK90_08645 [Kocuria coralli]|uniref:Heavy-metal-associated domain-containing protein n=1 Tax=Kocuria coralli TaxID=1461025 RepID=A0A5J5KX56_9MICC|nr:hypothetical protein [Kocuria coralli]KAA9393988.1 hypothetical protein FCK90_08645 [Kocuria coralli]
MISTTFIVKGMRTSGDARTVQAAMYHVTGVGGAATEIEDQESRIILKHKDDIVLDPVVIDQALRQAGNYSIA